MQLVSYHAGPAIRGGLSDGQRYYDLEAALTAAGNPSPVRGTREFLELVDWQDRLATLRARAGALEPLAEDVKLAAPVPVPLKLMIAGANTHSHLAEAEPLLGKVAPSKEPMVLAKATSSITGPYDPIRRPPETTKLDYEVEIGLVIGRQGRRIPESRVKDHVAGYVVLNEVSARDIQLAENEDVAFYRTHFIGKSYDTFTPMGPGLTTVDQWPWGKPIPMRTLVNGQVRQDSDTSDLIHGFEALVSYISRAMTLFPGDVIATGSPAGVAFFMKPQGFVGAGDVVRCEADGIGAIENPVEDEAPAVR